MLERSDTFIMSDYTSAPLYRQTHIAKTTASNFKPSCPLILIGLNEKGRVVAGYRGKCDAVKDLPSATGAVAHDGARAPVWVMFMVLFVYTFYYKWIFRY